MNHGTQIQWRENTIIAALIRKASKTVSLRSSEEEEKAGEEAETYATVSFAPPPRKEEVEEDVTPS